MVDNIETRLVIDECVWQEWKQPGESHRAQLRRIVNEWQEQNKILADLKAIHADPRQALGVVLRSHQLLEDAAIAVNFSSSTAIAEQVEQQSTALPASEDVEDDMFTHCEGI